MTFDSARVLGVEAAGIVRVVGTRVTRFVPGDSVLVHSAPLRYQGSWAERFLADAADVARMPPELEWAVAGALPVPLLTALQVVGATACGPNDTVLVNGGGGVTGGLIVAMAAGTGARIIATSSAEGRRRVRSYGAGEAIDYRDPAWRALAQRASSRRFSVVADRVPVLPQEVPQCLRCEPFALTLGVALSSCDWIRRRGRNRASVKP